MKIIIACGGTGGHAFPGIAVAEELVRRGHEVAIWDSGRSIESYIMKRWHGPIFTTKAKPLRLRNIFAVWRSIMRCSRKMKKEKPDVLLAMGSYSSLPPVLAAHRRKVRVVMHEANTVPGKAVDFLSRFADVVAISFGMTKNLLPKKTKTALTGLPVRDDIASGKRFPFIPANAFTIFVTGGSQGAHAVNELLSASLVMLQREVAGLLASGEATRPIYVIHQTGEKDEEMVKARYADAGVPSRVHAFETEMPDAFASADFVVARAGASTCFELASCGKPALLIPLPSAIRNHQHFNAEAFAAGGAAHEGIQSKLNTLGVFRYLLQKYQHPEQIADMAAKMGALSIPNSAVLVADILEGKMV